MKNVNELVLSVQNKGTESAEFGELFTILDKETIQPKAGSFSRQLNGDVAEGISEGYKLLNELVHSWEGSGNFHALFKISFENRLKNLIKSLHRDKRKHNTSYEVSLSETVNHGGGASEMLDIIDDSSLRTGINPFGDSEEGTRFEKLLSDFEDKHPEQAAIISIMLDFPNDAKKAEATAAFCEYYGVEKYTAAIQKRVSRARESFKKFMEKNEYAVAV